ncbi:hypothetical protein BH10ACT1_BH10ACT1_17320 [soil metagenome]
MGGAADAPRGAWKDDLGVASALTDAVVVLGIEGQIVWCNDAFCTLLGEPREALIGVDGLARVHPDELDRAIDGIDYAARFPGRTSVSPYRILHGDGHWLDVELKSGIAPRPEGDHLVLVLRDGGARNDISRALQSVAGGEPLPDTVRLVAAAIVGRWLHAAAAVSIGVRGGGREVLGHPLPPLLVEHAAGRLDHLGVPPPWVLARADGVAAVVDRTELPDALRLAAEEAGYEGFAVAPLNDPSGQPGCLIVWFDHTLIGRLEFRHEAAEFTELLGLALERRNHHWQLWHVASHDPLTGLLNRAGFFERFTSVVDRTRNGDGCDAVGVLFIDLDGLKAVNDRGGHAAGDRLLVDVAERLRTVVGRRAEVARLGGDEFVVFGAYPELDAGHRAEALAQEIVADLARPATDPRVAADSADVPVAASIGIAIDDGQIAPVRIVEQADLAMYRAKSAGRSRWSW